MLLQQVDRVEITILIDNVTDMLIQSSPHATRAPFFKGPLRAEHGFSALVDVHYNNISHRVLYDTGTSEDMVLFNANSLEIDLGSVETIVLSHGHLDHAGGLIPILKHISKPQMPVVLHPDAFLKRWVIMRNGQKIRLPSMEENKVFGIGVTRIQELPNYQQLEIVICTGKRRELWENQFVAAITEFAKLNKCKRLCIWARPGWEKVSKQWGWKKKHVQLEKWLDK